MQLSIKILGGIPVVMQCDIQGAEPDVGIMSAYVDEWSIVEAFGKPYRGAWLDKRIDDAEYDRITAALNEELYKRRYEY